MKLEEKDWTIPLIYLSIGLLWIGLSDALLFFLPTKFNIDSKSVTALSQWKGFLFVGITTVLLFYLIKRKSKTTNFVKNDFRRLFEDNPNPMLIFDMSSYNILLGNRAASIQYGYTLDEIKSLTVYDLRPEAERSKIKAFLDNLKDEYIDAGEWLHQDKFGNYFYVNIFSHKTIYQEKECRIINIVNVNKKILAEIERENFEKALDKAASVSITGINGNIQEVNGEFCRVSGYNKNELLGKPMEILESGYHNPKFWNDMWQKIKSGEIWRADIRNKDKSGDFYWVDIVISPIKNHKGEIYKFMSISYDITEKKNLEINQQKLLDDFTEYAFQTSHELRGPLTSMMGLASLFEKHKDPAFLVEKLKRTAEQMDVVIRKMNDSLSRTALNLIIKKRNN